mgnify:CR=1 FL=1
MLLTMATLYAPAQTNGSNSPYSRFGLGSLKDQSQGFNKAMSGVALGFRDGNRINMQNPASYSAIDSLSFIFDVGLTLQNVNMNEKEEVIVSMRTTQRWTISTPASVCARDWDFHSVLFLFPVLDTTSRKANIWATISTAVRP